MKKYQLFGMGNALVDMEFEVNDHFLDLHKVEKGVMTLVDETRQLTLLEQLAHVRRACGGSAANSIIAFSQLGGRAFYSCKVADDEFGNFYAQDLLSNGVQNNLKAHLAEGITGKCLVMITPDAERTMNTFLGITAHYSTKDLDLASLKESEYLYIEGYLVASPTAKVAAIEAKKFADTHGVKTAFTLSDANMVNFFKPGLIEIIGGQVDILFCNEHEALLFTGETQLNSAIEKLKSYARSFAITLGSKGALSFDGKNFHEAPASKVKAVDTNGAGDMFAGAFLYQLSRGNSYAEATKFACNAASQVVAQFGPRLTKEQVSHL